MAGAEFEIGDNQYDESDDEFTTMQLTTSINGRVVIAKIQYTDPVDVVALFYHLGQPESIENLTASLQATYQEKAMHDAMKEVDDGERTLEEIFGPVDDAE